MIGPRSTRSSGTPLIFSCRFQQRLTFGSSGCTTSDGNPTHTRANLFFHHRVALKGTIATMGSLEKKYDDQYFGKVPPCSSNLRSLGGSPTLNRSRAGSALYPLHTRVSGEAAGRGNHGILPVPVRSRCPPNVQLRARSTWTAFSHLLPILTKGLFGYNKSLSSAP